jgi:8-oxo-dGTP pyrophosphatase MutT (NUDIX family)
MIQRKDSLSFMEFIRGKYDVTDEAYIKKLLSGMTHEERNKLLTLEFYNLWNYIWLQSSIPRITIEYEMAKAKFEGLNEKLKEYINTTDSPYDESEFGFPKGRRKLKENDMVCAIREFHEETGFGEQDIRMCTDIGPFEEIFYGTNNVLYRHVYYVAQMMKLDSDDPQVDPANINQLREVRAVKWFDFDNTIAHIRDYNKERRDVFLMVHETVRGLKGMVGL